ncbi:helix-turn-helix domain-containing protein [Rhodococcus koreensis]
MTDAPDLHDTAPSEQKSAGGTGADLVRLAGQIARIASRSGAAVETIDTTVAEAISSYLGRPVVAGDLQLQLAMQTLIEQVSTGRTARHDHYRDLLDIVADLAMVADPDELQVRIAEQARRLLHADVVYLWMSDGQGQSMRLGATSGGLSSELRNLRIPVGHAMAGKIIDTGMPLVVTRYLDDRNFSHDAQMDRVMKEEGIVTAAGVPMTLGSQTRGALIAANRDEREYTLSHVELLRNLAIHASISLTRATVRREQEQSLLALVSDNADLTKRNEESDRIHTTVARVALTGGKIDDLVDEVIKIIGGRLEVFDVDGRLLAAAGGGPATEETTDLVRIAAETRVTQTTSQHAAVPIITSTGLHGVLCFRSELQLTHSDIQVVERVAVTAALLLLLVEAEAGAAGFRRDDFIDDLVTGSDTPARMVHRAAQMKLDLRRPYTVHIVRADMQERRLAYLANEYARTRSGLAGQCHRVRHDERPSVVVLLPGSDPRQGARELAEALQRSAHVSVSVAGAGPSRETAHIRQHFEEAMTCSHALLRIGGDGTSGTMEDLGFVGLVLSKDTSVRPFIETMLAPVIDYDAQHHTDLLQTLEALLSTEGGPTAASHQLHVHVSTVKQRMQRLHTLLGDWRSADRASELRLAIKLHRIYEGLTS